MFSNFFCSFEDTGYSSLSFKCVYVCVCVYIKQHVSYYHSRYSSIQVIDSIHSLPSISTSVFVWLLHINQSPFFIFFYTFSHNLLSDHLKFFFFFLWADAYENLYLGPMMEQIQQCDFFFFLKHLDSWTNHHNQSSFFYPFSYQRKKNHISISGTLKRFYLFFI